MADDRFPECESSKDLSPDGEVGYIGSSESVGAGHEDSENRLPPVGEFPNTETGEGKGFD